MRDRSKAKSMKNKKTLNLIGAFVDYKGLFATEHGTYKFVE
jgi:hypothetical protein